MEQENTPEDAQDSGKKKSQVPPPFRARPVERLKIAWKVFLFLVLAILIAPVIMGSFWSLFHGRPRAPFTPQFLLFVEVGSFLLVAGLTLLLARLDNRGFGEFGLPGKHAFRSTFWLGFLFGLAEASLLLGIIQLFGGYSFGTRVLHGSEIPAWGLLHLVLFLFVGLYEESAFRGYPLVTLTRAMGFWPSAILLSLTFGLLHLSNPGENWVGAASVILVGLFFAFTLKRSGNLWYAVGLHAGFDWAQSFLYSVPDSGEVLRGHLSNAVLQGPHWLTGGSVGPEASVFCFVTMGLQFLVVLWLFPAKPARKIPQSTLVTN